MGDMGNRKNGRIEIRSFIFAKGIRKAIMNNAPEKKLFAYWAIGAAY